MLVPAHLSCFVFLTLCYVLIRAAFILATWLGGFTLVYTTGVVQNLHKEKILLLIIHPHRRVNLNIPFKTGGKLCERSRREIRGTFMSGSSKIQNLT